MSVTNFPSFTFFSGVFNFPSLIEYSSKDGFKVGIVELADDGWSEMAVELVVGGGGIEGAEGVWAVELVVRGDGIEEVDDVWAVESVVEDGGIEEFVCKCVTVCVNCSKIKAQDFMVSSNVEIRFSKSSASGDEMVLEVVVGHAGVEEDESKVLELQHCGGAPTGCK